MSGSDIGEMWAGVREDEKRIRSARKAKNLEILRASTIPFQYRNGGDVVLIRGQGYPAVDFWPSTNTWQIGNRKSMGDAEALLDFLKLRAMK